MKTITFDETKWMLVPIEVDPDMVGAFVDASAIEGPCWAEATDGEKQEVVRMWAPCWAALLAATPAPAPAQERCHLCDCTGDVHDATGEWRGECPYCKPAQEVGLTDAALLDSMEHQRIAVIPEFEGGWDAQVYNEEAEPSVIGGGHTPRDALRNAISALREKGQQS